MALAAAEGQLMARSSLRELRASLRARGLPITGNKPALAAALAAVLAAEAAAEGFAEEEEALRPPPVSLAPPTVAGRATVVELRAALRARGLPVSGPKAALVQRLQVAARELAKRQAFAMPPKATHP